MTRGIITGGGGRTPIDGQRDPICDDAIGKRGEAGGGPFHGDAGGGPCATILTVRKPASCSLEIII